MGRSLTCALAAVVVGLWGCSGSDGHPPLVGDPGSGGTGGTAGGSGGRPTGTAGKKNEPANDSLLDGGFINIPTVNDIYLDEPRGVLYVSTNEGGLATVELSTGKISGQMIGEGPLMGLDLSPSGRYLAICENSVDKLTKQFWVHLVDLEESTQREVYFPQGFDLREGSHSAVFANDDTLFVTQSFTAGGYIDLLQVSLADDTYSTWMSIIDDSMLARSPDNSRLVLVEPNNGVGPVTVIDSVSLHVTEGLAKAMLHDLALNEDGSVVALPTKDAVKFLDLDEAGEASLREAEVTQTGRLAAAAAFSPVDHSLFVAWAEGANKAPATVDHYDLDTLGSLGLVNASVPLAFERVGDFEPTRMKISSDGTLLFVTVAKGISVYAL